MDSQSEISAHNSNKKPFYKKFRLTPKQKKVWKILLIILLTLSLFGGVYGVGYNKGYKTGEKAGKKSGQTTASNLFSNLQNPFQTVTGKVVKLDDNKLAVTTTKGETKTVTITDKTKITKKTETLSTADLKKDVSVTIFTQGEDNNLQATRIVVK